MPGKIADLNVRLGLDLTPFIREIKRVERRLNKFARNIEATGRTFTTSLTIPIAGAAGAAIKAFADFDKLQKGLEAVNVSSDAAAAQFNRLRKIAENPGIGLEQAIQGAIRLQAIGIEAKEAERTLLNLSKAVALTGTAENLDAVTVQFAQIASKGKVLSQDLRVALENAPALAEAFQRAFGTVDGESISAQVSGIDDFFDRVNKAIEESETFQKVQSSLANEFVNLGINLKFAAAEIGKYLSESFNLVGVLQKVGKFAANAADTFNQLDDSTKKQIVRFTAFVAAIGPGLLAIAGLTRGLRSIIGIYKSVQVVVVQVIKAIVAQTAVTKTADTATSGLIRSMNIFKNVQRALVASGGVFLLAAGIGLLVEQFLKVGNEIAEVNNAFSALANVQKQAEVQTRKELSSIDALIDKIENNNITRRDSVKAIQEIQNKYPDFLSNIDAEKVSIEDLKDARNELNKSILQSARARVAEEKLFGVIEEQTDIQDRQKTLYKQLARLRDQAARAGVDIENPNLQRQDGESISSFQTRQNAIEGLVNQYRKYQNEIQGTANQLGELLDIQEQLVDLASKDINTGFVSNNNNRTKVSQNDGSKKINQVAEANKLLLSALGGGDLLGVQEQVGLFSTSGKTAEELKKVKEEFRQLAELAEPVEKGFSALGETALTSINSLAEGFSEALNSAEGFGKGIAKTLAKVAQDIIRVAVAQVILKKLFNSGPIGAIVAGAAGIVASGIFKKIIGSIGVPFAKGGIVTCRLTH